jgi:MerR family transcriptional regulator/heat shock protein HspR
MDSPNPTFWPRERVAERLTISTRTLLQWETRGFVTPIRLGAEEGYGPTQIRRVWTILTFHRDLGINLAGIEVILRLLDQRTETHARLDELSRVLRSTLDDPAEVDVSHD